MTDPHSIKPEARQLVESLPDSATWDDLAYEVYVRQSIEAGLADAEAGRLVSHEDALARVTSRSSQFFMGDRTFKVSPSLPIATARNER